MQPSRSTASLRLEAETQTVEDLVGMVMRGIGSLSSEWRRWSTGPEGWNSDRCGLAIEQHGVAAFRRIFPSGEGLGQGPANRMLLAGSGAARRELGGYVFLYYRPDSESPVLLSHAIPSRAAHALSTGDVEGSSLSGKLPSRTR